MRPSSSPRRERRGSGEEGRVAPSASVDVEDAEGASVDASERETGEERPAGEERDVAERRADVEPHREPARPVEERRERRPRGGLAQPLRIEREGEDQPAEEEGGLLPDPVERRDVLEPDREEADHGLGED